jgi:hypothetical protein
MVLKISRELRAWFQLRSQLVRRQPAVALERSEPELPEEQLTRMAEVYLERRKKKQPIAITGPGEPNEDSRQ